MVGLDPTIHAVQQGSDEVNSEPLPGRLMSDLTFRDATEHDLPAIVDLLADDLLGGAREHPGDPAYFTSFEAMQARGGRILLAIQDNEIQACLQLDLLPGVSQRGMIRAQVEGVRVASTKRGTGIGAALMQEAIAQARQAGATSMQLTTNQARTEAQRFYKKLGFTHSHAGLKLDLKEAQPFPPHLQGGAKGG